MQDSPWTGCVRGRGGRWTLRVIVARGSALTERWLTRSVRRGRPELGAGGRRARARPLNLIPDEKCGEAASLLRFGNVFPSARLRRRRAEGCHFLTNQPPDDGRGANASAFAVTPQVDREPTAQVLPASRNATGSFRSIRRLHHDSRPAGTQWSPFHSYYDGPPTRVLVRLRQPARRGGTAASTRST